MDPGLVDCHCHLSAPDFDRDLCDVLEKARKANVTALVAVAEHSGEFERIMQLSERYSGFILPCLGVHPVQGLSPESQRSVTLKDLEEALPIIENYKDQLLAVGEVLLHAFDGRPSVAMEGVAAGYFFSVPPSIIRSGQKQKLVKQLPLTSLCLETDSPALGPEKQTRNEPCNITISAEYISQVKGIPVEEVIEVTTKNALKLFPRLRGLLQK